MTILMMGLCIRRMIGIGIAAGCWRRRGHCGRRRPPLLLEDVDLVGGMAVAKPLDMVLQRSLVLEVGSTHAVPN